MSHSWPLTKLSALLDPVSRTEKVDPTKVYRLLGVRLEGMGPFLRETKLGSQSSAGTLSRVETGDFIYSRLFAWRGAFGVVASELDGCYVSGEFPTFIAAKGRLDLEFLKYWFRIPAVLEQVAAECTGSTPLTRNRFKEEKFLALEIPIPPLSEQKRIVARIEELAGKIEEARGLRREASETIAAFDRSASVSLFSDPSHPLVPVGSFSDVRGGIQKCIARLPGSSPRRYITVAHVQRNYIDTSDPRYFEVSDEELERWRLVRGDVLVIEGNGSAEQIGRTALFNGEIENCVHQNHVIRIRSDASRAEPAYVNAYLNSSAGREEMRNRGRTTSGLFHLSVGRIREIRVPLPSLERQRRIVAYLDDLQSKVDALKKLQSETSAELAALLPSILDQAFKGEL